MGVGNSCVRAKVVAIMLYRLGTDRRLLLLETDRLAGLKLLACRRQLPYLRENSGSKLRSAMAEWRTWPNLTTVDLISVSETYTRL